MRKSRQPITLKDMALRLGVHTSTISRVLNGTEKDAAHAASESTVQRIKQLARELNYHPNIHAASLKTQRSHAISVLVPRLSDIVLATIYEGIDNAASKNGLMAFVSNTQDVAASQQELVELALNWQVDGFIFGDAHIGDHAFLDSLEKRGVPFVLVSRHAGKHISVTCDDYKGGSLVCEHFAKAGHRKLAVISGETFASTGADRALGFVEKAREHNISIPEKWIIPSAFDSVSGYNVAMNLLGQKDRPTAIFAVNDFLAIGVMGAAKKLGLVPGQDIAIVGYNDISLASRLPIPLSTIHSPMHEMGYRAVELLLEKIKGKTVCSIKLTPELIIRESSTLVE